jgi:hypothetical protein
MGSRRVARQHRLGAAGMAIAVALATPACASKEGPRMADQPPREAAAGSIAAVEMRRFMAESAGGWTRTTYTIPPVRTSTVSGETLVGQYRRGRAAPELTFSDGLRLPAPIAGAEAEQIQSAGGRHDVTRTLANGIVVNVRGGAGVDLAALRELLGAIDLAGLAALGRK